METSRWLMYGLAVVLANAPFLSQRVFFCYRLVSGTKVFAWRALEWLCGYALLLVLGLFLESRLGPVQRQGWPFYAITLGLFALAAWPGWVYRYIWRNPQSDDFLQSLPSLSPAQELLALMSRMAMYNDRGYIWSGHAAERVAQEQATAQQRVMQLLAELETADIPTDLLAALRSGLVVADVSGDYVLQAQRWWQAWPASPKQ